MEDYTVSVTNIQVYYFFDLTDNSSGVVVTLLPQDPTSLRRTQEQSLVSEVFVRGRSG